MVEFHLLLYYVWSNMNLTQVQTDWQKEKAGRERQTRREGRYWNKFYNLKSTTDQGIKNTSLVLSRYTEPL